MSELAAAGAALLAAPNPVKDYSDQESVILAKTEIKESDFLNAKAKSNLAVPENDSISSSEDENDDVSQALASASEAVNDFRAKTLQPQTAAPSFSSSLKRSFTLPRHPLFNLTNSDRSQRSKRVKKAKRN